MAKGVPHGTTERETHGDCTCTDDDMAALQITTWQYDLMTWQSCQLPPGRTA